VIPENFWRLQLHFYVSYVIFSDNVRTVRVFYSGRWRTVAPWSKTQRSLFSRQRVTPLRHRYDFGSDDINVYVVLCHRCRTDVGRATWRLLPRIPAQLPQPPDHEMTTMTATFARFTYIMISGTRISKVRSAARPSFHERVCVAFKRRSYVSDWVLS